MNEDQHPLLGDSAFGELGESTEEHELKRVRGLIGDEPPAPPSVPEIFRENADKERALMVQAVTAEVTREIAQLVAGLRADIVANTELMRTMDVPVEAVIDSHERASTSFETLRKDLQDIGMETPAALKDLARVMDTAGLNEAQSRAQQRFEVLTKRLEAQMEIMVDGQSKAFRALAADMVKVLHLLERLQARELADAKKRLKKRVKK